MDEVRVCKRCQQEKPITEFFRNKNGYTDVCMDCAMAKRKESRGKKSRIHELEEQLAKARDVKLSEFSPRELMAELHRRGFEGNLLAPRQSIDIARM